MSPKSCCVSCRHSPPPPFLRVVTLCGTFFVFLSPLRDCAVHVQSSAAGYVKGPFPGGATDIKNANNILHCVTGLHIFLLKPPPVLSFRALTLHLPHANVELKQLHAKLQVGRIKTAQTDGFLMFRIIISLLLFLRQEQQEQHRLTYLRGFLLQG